MNDGINNILLYPLHYFDNILFEILLLLLHVCVCVGGCVEKHNII